MTRAAHQGECYEVCIFLTSEIHRSTKLACSGANDVTRDVARDVARNVARDVARDVIC
jgi:hypothetical protein